MAELHVERKDTAVWPWILVGLALLALILWFIFGRSNDTAPIAADTDTTSTFTMPAAAVPVDEGAPAAVTGFVQFVDDQGAATAAGLSHEYTADGVRRLVGALDALSDRDSASGVALQPRFDEIRQRADAMQQDPTSTEHSRQAREAFVMAAGVMEQMQQSGFSADQASIAEVRTAAEAVQPDGMLLDQSQQVQQFFERARTAVRSLAGMTGAS